MKSSIKKLAAEANKKMPITYDLSVNELKELLDEFFRTRNPNMVYEAVVTAYQAGFVRGHRATVRGRIGKKPLIHSEVT
ncbi:MAG: hypothetical protein IJJ80_01235 [Clostridia bacterium]|nr:hypothetical protein [Clostridia bacterium]